MPEATTWDLWYGGLFPEGPPEPPGRRSPAELAALEAEGAQNFERACAVLRERPTASRQPTRFPFAA
jgi:hypothetical protein